jgi:hypothetical protein
MLGFCAERGSGRPCFGRKGQGVDMPFLSLFLELMLMFGGSGGVAVINTQSVDDGGVHRIHGHLPGPQDGHDDGSTPHAHHGQHGHTAGGPIGAHTIDGHIYG